MTISATTSWLTFGLPGRYNIGMLRWLAVAALSAALLTLPAWSQRRGGGAGGFAGHAGFSGAHMTGRGPHMAGPTMSARGFPSVQRGGVNFVMGNFGRGFGYGGFAFHHRRFWGYPYAGYYGYPYYGWWGYGDDSYSAASYQNYPPPDYSTAYIGSDRQQAAIDRLENEVDRLRQEREARESQTQTRSKSDSQPAQLVFRDKHTEEVQNYAIVGQTLWILNAQRARKIPLTELDIPATKKANDDRGVDFQLPG